MASILGRHSIDNIEIIEVDGDPSATGGTSAPLGSLASQIDGGGLWIKSSVGDTGWKAASDVIGPASSTDDAVARFDGVTGKILQNSPATIDDGGSLTVGATATAGRVHFKRGSDGSATGSIGWSGGGAEATTLAILNSSASGVIRLEAPSNVNLVLNSVERFRFSDSGLSAWHTNAPAASIDVRGDHGSQLRVGGTTNQAGVIDLVRGDGAANATVGWDSATEDNVFAIKSVNGGGEIKHQATLTHRWFDSASTQWMSLSSTELQVNNILNVTTDGSAALPAIIFGSVSDPDTGFYKIGVDSIGVTAGGAERMSISSATLVINNVGSAYDTRIEGLNLQHLIFVDGSEDKVGINSSSPNEILTVGGVISLAETTAPSLTAGFGKLYASSANSRLHFLDDAGQSHLLTADTVAAITWAASTALDLDPSLAPHRTLALTGETTFTTTNLGAGRSLTVRVDCDGTTRTLTFPAGWTWLGVEAPTELAANDTAILAVTCFGTADTDVVASWVIENQLPAVEVSDAAVPASGQVAFWDDVDAIRGSADLAWSDANGLVVNNVVESLVGGFKFPDDTVQTTAAADFAGVSVTAPITGDGVNTDLAIPAATAGQDGYLTSTDWTTFNNKGDVSGPAGPVADNALVRFDLTTGKLVKDSSLTLDDDGVLARTGNLTLQPTLDLLLAPDTGWASLTGPSATLEIAPSSGSAAIEATSALSVVVSGDLTLDPSTGNAIVDGNLALTERTAPTAVAGQGKFYTSSVDKRPHFVDDSDQDHLLTKDLIDAITWAASTALDLSPALPSYRTLTLTDDTTFTTSNLGDGRSAVIKIVGGASDRALTFPAGWTWMGGGSAPALLEADDVAVLSIASFGSADADVVAHWSKESVASASQTLAWASSVDLDFNPTLSAYRSVALAGNTTFTTSNLGSGRNVAVRVIGGGSDHDLTWPVGWSWLGIGAPSDLVAGGLAILSLVAFGSADSDVVASWTV